MSYFTDFREDKKIDNIKNVIAPKCLIFYAIFKFDIIYISLKS